MLANLDVKATGVVDREVDVTCEVAVDMGAQPHEAHQEEEMVNLQVHGHVGNILSEVGLKTDMVLLGVVLKHVSQEVEIVLSVVALLNGDVEVESQVLENNTHVGHVDEAGLNKVSTEDGEIVQEVFVPLIVNSV